MIDDGNSNYGISAKAIIFQALIHGLKTVAIQNPRRIMYRDQYIDTETEGGSERENSASLSLNNAPVFISVE